MGLPDEEDANQRRAEQASGQIFSPDQLIHVTIDGEEEEDDGYSHNRNQQQDYARQVDDAIVSNAHENHVGGETTPLVSVISPIDDQATDDDFKPPSNEHPIFQDVWFAVLWILQFVTVLYMGLFVAPRGYVGIEEQMNEWNISALIHQIPDQSDDMTPEEKEEWEEMFDQFPRFVDVYLERIVKYTVLPAIEAAVVMSLIKIFFLFAPCAKNVVRGSLIMTLLLASVFAVSNVINSSSWLLPMLVSGLVLGGVSYFVYRLWPLVPFASVNLRIALKAVSFNNCGAFVWGLVLTELCCYWVCFWFYTSFGTLNLVGKNCGTSSDDSPLIEPQFSCTSQGWLFLFFVLSLYWTTKVFMNTIQVTVAGVMATWCFDNDSANGCCSSAVTQSVVRSLTYSFGSICLGSLFQGIISVIREIVHLFDRRRETNEGCTGCCGSLLMCITDFVVKALEDVLEYFNRWAFVYCGIYGYSYLKSGRSVMELFKAKGWSAIITDRLVDFVLKFVNVVNGVVTALAVLGIERIVSLIYLPDDDSYDMMYGSYVFGPLIGWRVYAIIIGFVIGYIVSAVMVNVIQGAVNTLIVCWADSPSRLEENHPELAQEMRDAWRAAFPAEADVQAEAIATPASGTPVYGTVPAIVL